MTLIVFGGISIEGNDLMNDTFLYSIDLQNLSESKIELLRVKGQSDSLMFEQLEVADRFFMNQYFPIDTAMITEDFIETHVSSEIKKMLLRDCKKKRCDLIGIVGRKALHIFDKTYMTWICSSAKLGYETLLPTADSDSGSWSDNSNDSNDSDIELYD